MTREDQFRYLYVHRTLQAAQTDMIHLTRNLREKYHASAFEVVDDDRVVAVYMPDPDPYGGVGHNED